ncbi:hypothetical protein STW0522PSE72_16100 [Pseudomonas monteilii]|nr:hypothetical protein STW0522PSE72_16100 [Pseudomonas monteilii]
MERLAIPFRSGLKKKGVLVYQEDRTFAREQAAQG